MAAAAPPGCRPLTGATRIQYRDSPLPDLRWRRSPILAQVGPLPYPLALLPFPQLLIAALLFGRRLLLALQCFALGQFALLHLAPRLLFAPDALFTQDLGIAIGDAARLIDPLGMGLATQLLITAGLGFAALLLRTARLCLASRLLGSH